MVQDPKPLSRKIRLTPKSFEKCEELCYRGGAKHLLTACGTVCFAMLFRDSVELRIFTYLLLAASLHPTQSSPHRQCQRSRVPPPPLLADSFHPTIIKTCFELLHHSNDFNLSQKH
ncbi:hypothetical protein TNCV_1263871 [Trichonephila clavipes]|nr:hypothetical protein TNCV_1263871 [Trichonephila clavipes]